MKNARILQKAIDLLQWASEEAGHGGYDYPEYETAIGVLERERKYWNGESEEVDDDS